MNKKDYMNNCKECGKNLKLENEGDKLTYYDINNNGEKFNLCSSCWEGKKDSLKAEEGKKITVWKHEGNRYQGSQWDNWSDTEILSCKTCQKWGEKSYCSDKCKQKDETQEKELEELKELEEKEKEAEEWGLELSEQIPNGPKNAQRLQELRNKYDKDKQRERERERETKNWVIEKAN